MQININVQMLLIEVIFMENCDCVYYVVMMDLYIVVVLGIDEIYVFVDDLIVVYGDWLLGWLYC